MRYSRVSGCDPCHLIKFFVILICRLAKNISDIIALTVNQDFKNLFLHAIATPMDESTMRIISTAEIRRKITPRRTRLPHYVANMTEN